MRKKTTAVLAAAALLLSCLALHGIGEDSQDTAAAADDAAPTLSGLPTTMQLQMADTDGKAPIEPLGENDELVAENESLRLYVDRTTANIKVINRQTGYVWSSTVSGEEELDTLSNSWQQFARSVVVGDFIASASGSVRRMSMEDEGDGAPVISDIENGIAIQATFSEAQASCRVEITLEEDSLKVVIPQDSLTCGDSYTLSALYVMPFFGAVYSDSIDGYIFIPDGCGALIRYQEPRSYSSYYSGRIYGSDLSLPSNSAAASTSTAAAAATTSAAIPTVDNQQVTLPVYGMAHGSNQDAFLAVVAQGDSSCDLIASAAGTTIDFSWACPRFIYQETYWQPAGSSTGFNATQPNVNTFDAEVRYYFLGGEEANYTGMANRYRSLLQQEGRLTTTPLSGENIPIKLDAVMAERAEGYWMDYTKVMTTLEDVSGWVEELSQSGVSHILMTLEGFEKGGISGHTIGSFSLESKVGSESQLEDLFGQLSSAGGRLALQTSLSTGFSGQMNQRNMRMSAASNLISRTEVHNLYTTRYYLNAAAVTRNIEKLADLDAYKKSLALDDIGNILFGDYKSGHTQSRLQALEQAVSDLQAAAQSTDYLMLENPNAYALNYADAVYNVPMANSMMKYETDTVPFVQIVLSGYVDCFSDFINYGGNTEQMLLMLVDYNICPSFVLTQAYSSEFADTNSSDIYSSRYEDWKQDIVSSYEFVNDCLSRVRGSSMVSRSVPVEGVSVVTYDNGVTLIINYNEEAYTYGGSEVAAMSAVWTEG
ncbi:MAG TPA: hypothetical protein H9694_03250 [Firmicutes bacterium]|nr:hypothetical protein [Bacillota bacterium]